MSSNIVKCFTFLYLAHISVHAKFVQNLNGIWNVRDANEDYNLPANIPGGIYTDLMNNNIIEDVFYRFNDVDTRWVSKISWIYARNFRVARKLKNLKNINLIFDGVDTFSEIYLNNKKIGTTDNMFVKYIFDIKSKLKEENYLEIRFTSAVNKTKELFDEHKAKKGYPVMPLCVPDEYNGECHANHARKMQASFSWDWGPALPSVGLWKNVYMEGYNDAVIRDVTVKVSLNDKEKQWNIAIGVYLEASRNMETIQADFIASIQMEIGVKHCYFNGRTIKKNEDGQFVDRVICNVGKDNVKLWWPNGYGEAKLYSLYLSYYNQGGSGEKDKRNLKIGFRTIKLIENEIDSGRKFYFEVNGLPIFAKGTNSIPINILPERGQNEATIRYLLESAKDANMNMIRVWGGGSYEADIFYEIADELGIMIWQDFMFACAMYPTDDVFLDSVKKEVKHQVRRLQYHPSIVIWAGNNENEAALRQNWYNTKHNYDKYKEDYIKLYVNTIKPELLKSDDSRSYLVSSPTNGVQSEKEGYIAENPQSHFFGDVHFYNYENDSWNANNYPISRFASEYGYQSLPTYDTLSSATDVQEDLEMDSEFLNHRQHLPSGYQKLLNLISYQLDLPKKSSKGYLETLIYYSQIIQAMAVKIQTEYYRQWRSSTNSEGKGFTMGALYWQLNDVWVAPTWAGIDFENNWKIQHYYAKNFFSPVIVTGHLDINGHVNIYVISDLQNEIPNVSLNIHVYWWNLTTPVNTETLKINVPPNCSTMVRQIRIKDYLSQIKDRPCGATPTKKCFIYFTLTSDKNEKVAPDNFVFLVPLNQGEIHKYRPTLNVNDVKEVKGSQSKEFEIEITAHKVALFVWLETKSLKRSRFSDNGFVQVTPKKTVRLVTELPSTVDKIRKSLKISSLFKTYTGDDDVKHNGSQKILSTHWTLILIFLTWFYNQLFF